MRATAVSVVLSLELVLPAQAHGNETPRAAEEAGSLADAFLQAGSAVLAALKDGSDSSCSCPQRKHPESLKHHSQPNS